MREVIFPGSFDPPTLGHLNIIERIAHLFEKTTVVIAANNSKKALLTVEQRIKALREATQHLNSIEIDSCNTLIAEYARAKECTILVRGVRSEADFSYEMELRNINHQLNSELETFLIPAASPFNSIRSSYIKELWTMGADLSGLVPDVVVKLLEELKNKH